MRSASLMLWAWHVFYETQRMGRVDHARRLGLGGVEAVSALPSRMIRIQPHGAEGEQSTRGRARCTMSLLADATGPPGSSSQGYTRAEVPTLLDGGWGLGGRHDRTVSRLAREPPG